jgi:hypothetical protein
MVRANGIYRIQQRHNDTGRWFTVEEFKPRTSQKTVKWFLIFKAVENIVLDAVDDIRAQAVKRARELNKEGFEHRVQEERVAEGWRGEETIWQNGKWTD